VQAPKKLFKNACQLCALLFALLKCLEEETYRARTLDACLQSAGGRGVVDVNAAVGLDEGALEGYL
jgi:hypothetical protein